MQPTFSSNSRQEYHEGMLLVQLRSQPPFAPMIAANLAAVASTSSGVSAMAFYERAGLIKRVTPVARPGIDSQLAFRAGGIGATSAVFAAAAAKSETPGDGLSLVELERHEDVAPLQLALANDPSIDSVSKVPIRYLEMKVPVNEPTRHKEIADAEPTAAAVPPPAASMWNLLKIAWSQARQLPGYKMPTNIDVAVLDTGVDVDHPDLVGAIADYKWQHPDLSQPSSQKDIVGHGTHVAGTIGAGINNGLGINGICRPRIHCWKIFSDQPTYNPFSNSFGYTVDPIIYLRALLDCVSSNIDVVNLSIGGPGRPSAPEAKAFQSLIQKGTIVVAAMGNEREFGSPTSYPAAITDVIAVGATGIADTVSGFSNSGGHILMCAPGEAIWSTLPTYPGQTGFDAALGPDGRPRQGKARRRAVDYAAWEGTSMATPHVTASVALYLAKGGATGTTAVRSALKNSVDRVKGMGGASHSPDYGYGRLNLEKLLR